MAWLLGAPPEHRSPAESGDDGRPAASPSAGARAATPPRRPPAVAPPPTLRSCTASTTCASHTRPIQVGQRRAERAAGRAAVHRQLMAGKGGFERQLRALAVVVVKVVVPAPIGVVQTTSAAPAVTPGAADSAFGRARVQWEATRGAAEAKVCGPMRKMMKRECPRAPVARDLPSLRQGKM